MVDSVFLICAVVGGGVFAVRTVMQLLGVGGGDPADTDVGDGDDGFRILSLQGLSAFLTMFGLVGLALTRQSGAGPTMALGAAAAAATASVWVIGRVFRGMSKLQSSGTLSMQNAVGQEGVVYLSIGKGAIGKVQVEVQGRLGTWDAQTVDQSELTTGKRVRVVRVAPGDLLIVEAI